MTHMGCCVEITETYKLLNKNSVETIFQSNLISRNFFQVIRFFFHATVQHEKIKNSHSGNITSNQIIVDSIIHISKE